ncbi:insulin receptor substrate 1-B [Engraulis encrasicolus]|uniref:insulin receptor substrate 1-B n=1 Tax=Engraulis encrasicolus TaxID=184585 RepID=UPI002FCF3D5B
MENHALVEQQCYDDVRKSGYLRKQKSMHRRFFVLRAASDLGPARLEYYENEKKFRSKSPVPKKMVNLESCFNINKRADSKNKHMIVLYTRGESFAIAADSEEVQNEWYQAMLDLQCRSKTPDDSGSGGDCSSLPSPGPAFKEVWQVKVWPKGLGQARNLVGIYRLCLTDKTVNFVKLNSDVAAVVLQLMNVRRCGHSENFFFIEVGRSAMTGPGEFWMQVEDSVVAQNMHETLLEAMKALSEEFRQRTKTQSVGASAGGGTASNPISVPSRRHHPNLPPSQVGFSRRARTETPGGAGGGGGGLGSTNTSPTPRHGFSRSRTASIGARTDDSTGSSMARSTAPSTSPSLNGSSCSTTPTLRPKPTRAPTPAKITLSLARYTPNPAPSPAPSLSSSSGHGSECGLITVAGGCGFGTVPMPSMPISAYARVPQHRVSMSGSPSDYGSSDEYGSSPGEHSLLGSGPPAMSMVGLGLQGGSSSYIVMGNRDAAGGSHSHHHHHHSHHHHHRSHGRRMLRRSSSRECKAERRLLSKRASLPSTATQERLVPQGGRREDEEDEDEDYAVMSRSVSRESFTSRRGSSGGGGGGGHSGGTGHTGHGSGSDNSLPSQKVDSTTTTAREGETSLDSGYMSMLPGVTATTSVSLSLSIPMADGSSKGGTDEYMAMTPNSSVSPPQHGRLPSGSEAGYMMMMSPNSSGSPDLHGHHHGHHGLAGSSGALWGSRGSVESRAGSDYMNMSPISARSACSTPPSSTHADHHHGHQQQASSSSAQQQPKMVYSYFSLPRSYKHTSALSARFEDDLGQGKRAEVGGGGGGGAGTAGRRGGRRGYAGGQEDPGNVGHPGGGQLSLSSSSFSSSSASSESLEDRPMSLSMPGGGGGRMGRVGGGSVGGFSVGGARGKDLSAHHHHHQHQRQKQAHAQQQQQQRKGRHSGFFVDMSKANTLPRVRENLLPAVGQSPGEYVSIAYGEECVIGRGGRGRGQRGGGRIDSSGLSVASGPPRPLHRPPPCPSSGDNLPRSFSAPLASAGSSEYVNMDLGNAPSPLSPRHHTTLSTFSPGHAPLAAKSREERGNVPQTGQEAETTTSSGRRKAGTLALVPADIPAASFTEYSEMVFVDPSVAPQCANPSQTHSAQSSSSSMTAQDEPTAKPYSSPDRGSTSRLVRADPLTRRRHRSETFIPPPALASASPSPLYYEGTQVVSSSSTPHRVGLEPSPWSSSSSTGQTVSPPNAAGAPSSSDPLEQGLNYIDLDLASKEAPQAGLDGSSSVGVGAGGTGSSINTYASIDFYKSEELRAHQNNRNDCKDC